MKLGEFFKRAIDVGIDADMRGRKAVLAEMDRLKSSYDAKSKREKQWFDTERLENPYTDTKLLNGDIDTVISKIAVGVDCDNSELLLINELNKNGAKVDALMAHHPCGRAMGFHHVMGVQIDMFESWGMPVTQAEGIMADRISEVSRALMPKNTRRVLRTAQLLGIPFFNIHTPADNLVQEHVKNTIDAENPRTISDLIEMLTDSYEEYKLARQMQEAMVIFAGKKENRCGKIVVKMAGGTQGPTNQFEKLAQAGVGTMVCMHLSDEARKDAKKHRVNVLIAGHMASDSIGLNLLLSKVDPNNEVEVLPLSGLIYVDRR